MALVMFKQGCNIRPLLCCPHEKLIRKLRPALHRDWQHWTARRNWRLVHTNRSLGPLPCSPWKQPHGLHGRSRSQHPDENPQPMQGTQEEHPKQSTAKIQRERESMDESGWQIWAQNPKRNWRKSESGPSPGYPIVSLKSFWCALWLLDSDFIREDWRNIDRSGRCRQVGPRRRSTILTQSDANRLVFGSSGKGDTDPPLSLQTDRSKLP